MCVKLLLLLLLGICSAGFSKKEADKIPDFVVTEQEFPDFDGLEAGESQSQVFSIRMRKKKVIISLDRLRMM